MMLSTIKSNQNKSHSRAAIFLRKVGAALFWVLVWEAAAFAVNREVLIASPLRVAQRLCELAVTSVFWQSVLFSIGRILLGFLLGLLFAVFFASLTVVSPAADSLFAPLLTIIRATPVASFIILALVWMEKSSVTVFIAFLMVLPVLWGNLTAGLRAVDPGLREMTAVFGLSFRQRLGKLIIPSVMPYFTAGVRTGLGFCWKAGIAAEVLCTPALSIGKELYNAKIYLETADVFAWTVVIILLSVLFERLVFWVLKKAGRRYHTEAGGAAV